MKTLYGHEALFEFILPLRPISDLNAVQVDHYKQLIRVGKQPTAVGISILDVKKPVRDNHDVVQWCLAHYLMDGHHKMFAASCWVSQ